MDETRHHRFVLLLLAATVLGLSACNAPKVRRTAEIERFEKAVRARHEDLKLNPSEALTVERCVQIALVNSLALRVRRETFRLQDDNVRLALATGLPSAHLLYANKLRSNENLIRQDGFVSSVEPRHTQTLEVVATVPILDFGLTYYAWRIAQDRRTQEMLILRRAEQQLSRDVRIAYARHASELRQLKLQRVNIKAAQELLRVAAAMEREGLSTSAETAVVRATLAEATVALANAEQRVAETRLALAQFLSLPPATPIVVEEELPQMPAPPGAEVLAGMENYALRVRPELRDQDLELHISANAVRREVAALFPRLDGVGSFNWSNNGAAVNPAYFVGGFQVAQSLLEGGARIWRIDQAKITVDIEKERVILLSLGVLYDVELRAIQLQRTWDRINALEVQEKARREAFERIVSLYKEGLENEAGTVKAMAELSSQSAELDQARTDYIVAQYEFDAAALPQEPEDSAKKEPETETDKRK